MKDTLRRMKPHERRRLMQWLELGSDNPEVAAGERTRMERHLRNIKAILRKDKGLPPDLSPMGHKAWR